MNKSIIIATAAAVSAALLSGCAQKGGNLSGRIEMDRDTLLVQIMDATGKSGKSTIDTLVLENGRFSASVPDTSASFLYFIPKPKSENEMMALLPTRALFLPGDRMEVTGKIENLRFSGTELYDALSGTEYMKMENSRNALRAELQTLYTDAEGNRSLIDSIRSALSETDARLDSARFALVKESPESMAAGYATLFLPDSLCVEAGKILSPKVREGRMKPVLDNIIRFNETSLAKKNNWNKLVPGSPAPEFRLKNTEGEYMTLASFRGKYVLIDFWGTWCGWCIKGIPDMKESYRKHKAKIEFVGIDCRDTEEKWKKGVEEHGLPWTNLYSGNDMKVILDYGVQGFPSKVIVDPEGNIVDKYIGEDPALYKRLDILFR